MKKKVTKEEVERVLQSKLPSKYYSEMESILDELFPSFKVGDKVMVTKIPKSGHWICDDDRRIFTLKGGIENGFYGTGDGGFMYGLEGCEFRHATTEEIAAAEWEPNKPYKVWIDGEWNLRVSSNVVGNFYTNGRFKGTIVEHDKYEKL
jgi:hypothetical protein